MAFICTEDEELRIIVPSVQVEESQVGGRNLRVVSRIRLIRMHYSGMFSEESVL